MPVIMVEGPKINDKSQKKQMAKEITDAAVKAYGMGKEKIVILIRENSPENVAVAGELISEHFQK